MLNRIRSVMHEDPTDRVNGRIAYRSSVDEGENAPHVVYLDVAAVFDMGAPSTITMTIEPGDLLNEPEG